MNAAPVAILGTGLVTSVGSSAAGSCAAFRAKLTNPSQTRFIDSGRDWIMAHAVQFDESWRGLTKLAKMAAMAIDEALQDAPQRERSSLPLLLCVAELERPGRAEGLDDELLLQIQTELGLRFSAQSRVIARGRVSVAVALAQARTLMANAKIPRALIVATDSLLSWPTLSHFERNDRLLTPRNSDGFMPGEGAGALLVGASEGCAGELICAGIGFGREVACIESGKPLRADGLSEAINAGLVEAGCQMHEMDFRVTDNSGELYYFKEAALALSRTLKKRKEEFDIWHPAECTGEIGAASGVVVITTVRIACLKGYAKGPNVLAHWANDDGQRAALALRFRVVQ